MYKGFNLDLDGMWFSDHIDEGRSHHAKNKREVRRKLDSFKRSDGSLNGSRIIADWFPPINANVFLSHSHRDEELVLGLSGWLYEKFEITSFVDSCIWGFSEDLLKMIDKEYCYDKRDGFYSYEKRNKSTSHVYMMLSVALSKMIDTCECIIFINTPNSILPKDYFNTGNTTLSPWIYSEIAMTSLIQKRSPESHRGIFQKSLTRLDSVSVSYDVDLKHLIPIEITDLLRWENNNSENGSEALDALYRLF